MSRGNLKNDSFYVCYMRKYSKFRKNIEKTTKVYINTYLYKFAVKWTLPALKLCYSYYYE